MERSGRASVTSAQRQDHEWCQMKACRQRGRQEKFSAVGESSRKEIGVEIDREITGQFEFSEIPFDFRRCEKPQVIRRESFLDKNDEICGYEFVHMGKFMDEIKKGTDANEALKKVTGTYGRVTEEQGAVKKIDPRHE